MAPIRNINALIDGGYVEPSGIAPKKNFVPVKTITNQYGEKVQVDSNGLDSEGNLVIAAETPEDTAARIAADRQAASAGRKELRRFFLGSGAGRMLVIQYDDGTEQQIPSPQGEDTEKEKVGPSAEQRSAFALLREQLASWGLADLSDWAISLYQGENAPVDYNEFYALMKQQPVYQERFGKTNAARTAAGLAQLTEGQIMDLENSYKKTMQSYGLPASFYDSPEDYRKFIAADISAAELADRVQAADAYVKSLNPQIRSQLNSYYGINDGALAAATLDPKKGQDILQQLASRTTTAIAAGTAGLGTEFAKQAEMYGAGEMGFAKQAQAFAQAAQTGARGDLLSQVYAQQGAAPYGTEQAVAETFGAPTSVQEADKRKRLAKMEIAQFSGASGAAPTALTGSAEAGML